MAGVSRLLPRTTTFPTRCRTAATRPAPARQAGTAQPAATGRGHVRTTPTRPPSGDGPTESPRSRTTPTWRRHEPARSATTLPLTPTSVTATTTSAALMVAEREVNRCAHTPTACGSMSRAAVANQPADPEPPAAGVRAPRRSRQHRDRQHATRQHRQFRWRARAQCGQPDTGGQHPPEAGLTEKLGQPLTCPGHGDCAS